MSILVTSARNQFRGKIASITTGAVNSEVVLDIGSDQIVAIITNQSVEELGLAVDHTAYAITKSSWVVVAKSGIKTSSRNQLSGTIISCTSGAVNTEVVIALSGDNAVTSIITNESAKMLDLKEGDTVTALIKASHVIIAVP
ncbi:MAG: TOBE domain-containing protein [Betaproteobacteria bacterium]|nr:TOBE domain-containing protein [Betaproteobacteria bacterium]